MGVRSLFLLGGRGSAAVPAADLHADARPDTAPVHISNPNLDAALGPDFDADLDAAFARLLADPDEDVYANIRRRFSHAFRPDAVSTGADVPRDIRVRPVNALSAADPAPVGVRTGYPCGHGNDRAGVLKVMRGKV